MLLFAEMYGLYGGAVVTVVQGYNLCGVDMLPLYMLGSGY